MPRRRVVAAREILPDPKFGSQTIQIHQPSNGRW